MLKPRKMAALFEFAETPGQARSRVAGTDYGDWTPCSWLSRSDRPSGSDEVARRAETASPIRTIEAAIVVRIGKRQKSQSIVTADEISTATSAATFNVEFFMPTTPKLSANSHFLDYE